MTMRVMGVYLGHDLGACLIEDGEVIVLIEEERLNRYKHGRPNELAGLWRRFAGQFGYFPWASVTYCLRAAGLTSLDEIDVIYVGDHIWASDAEHTIASVIPVGDPAKIHFVNNPEGAEHHYHHALAAFFASGFDDAAVLVIDADGIDDPDGYEAESGFVFENRLGDHHLVFKNRYKDTHAPRSGIGWMYEQVTMLLGFTNSHVFVHHPGKTMGLASFGSERTELNEPWISHDGFTLEFSGFKKWLSERRYDTNLLTYAPGLAADAIPSAYACDIARKAQVELEDTLLALAESLQRKTGNRRLCFAGGVALNSVANGKLIRSGIFDEVYLLPGAHDGGQALGLAYHAYLSHRDVAPLKPLRSMFLGRDYKNREIEELLTRTGLMFERVAEPEECAAEDLDDGGIIGWFQGKSEFGPRALGHRSILADPRPANMRDTLNARVKFREGFRPFAPAVIVEYMDEVFDLQTDNPYMMAVAPVRESWRARIPSVTHVDGTARVQTVSCEDDAQFHQLITSFFRRTGVPLVVNTSFNLRGMPIVETPYDALHCFLFTEIDAVYLGPYRVQPPNLDDVILEYTEGINVEVSSSIDGQTSVRAKHASGKEVSISIETWFSLAIPLLDGRRSLADLVDVERQPETLRIAQRLARAGIVQFHVGEEVFGAKGEGLHWWQQHHPR